jgi:hypothetical protein
MPKMMSNPAGAYGLSPDFQDYLENHYQNDPTNGTTRTVGDVVVALPGPANTTAYYNPQVGATTTAASAFVIGVVGEPAASGPDSGQVGGGVGQAGGAGSSGKTFAKGAELPVVTDGIARINIAGNAVANGAALVTSVTTGVAAASATPALGTVIGIAIEDSTTSAVTVGGVTTIRAIIKKM